MNNQHLTGGDKYSLDIPSENKNLDIKKNSEGENNKPEGSKPKPIGHMTLDEIVKQYKQNKADESEPSSCFDSSSDDEDPFNNYKNNRNFIPLYRKEHGGIVIYDCDANIPGQHPPDTEYSDEEDEGRSVS